MVATRFVKAEELALLDSDNRLLELIEGELDELSPAGLTHTLVISRLNLSLSLYVAGANGLQLWPGDAGFVLHRDPDSVLSPDLSIVSDDQLESIEFGDEGFAELAPVIAVEVKSPSNSEAEIARKLGLYLSAGVREIWWVRPIARQVSVHRSDAAPIVLHERESLTSHDLLPGFELPLADLFRSSAKVSQ